MYYANMKTGVRERKKKSSFLKKEVGYFDIRIGHCDG